MEWDGLFYATHPDVYDPSDDSFLLARAVAAAVAPGDRFLEVGCGTGLVSLSAARAGAAVTATDANPHAVTLALHNGHENGFVIDVVRADLLAGLVGPFDVVAFNPPYLPTAPEEKVKGILNIAFDGGPDGNEVVLRFVEQLASLDSLPRQVLVIHSSLSDPGPLMHAMGTLGYADDIAASERFFHEELTVRRFRSAPVA